MILKLKRYPMFQGMTGFLSSDEGLSDLVWPTVERPWKNNLPNFSCVPAGRYTLEYLEFNRWGWRFALDGETVSPYKSDKARYACLIHPASRPEHVSGCIGLLGVPDGEFEERLLEYGSSHILDITYGVD